MQSLFDGVFNYIRKNGSKIAFNLGLIGTVTAGVKAVINTPKACKAIEKKKEELGVEKLPAKELLKTATPFYVGPVILEVLSIVDLSIVNMNKDRNYLALASAYTFIEENAKDYQEKVIETIGEKKEKKIQESIEDDKLRKIERSSAIETGYGHDLFWDPFSSRSFICSKERINEALNLLSHDIYAYDSQNINAFYDYINLDRTIVGDHIIWDIEKMKKPAVKLKPKYGPDREGKAAIYLKLDPSPILERATIEY